MAGPAPRRVSLEELRPTSLDEIVEQSEAVERLRRISRAVVAGRMLPPHLLFHGPPGVGKTTAARAFARAILGEEWERSFHQLDAGDDRGLEVIRPRILPQSRSPPSRGARARVFFFDDADAFDEEEQEALRPAFEGTDGSTVIILACNRLDVIGEPLQSRCSMLEFRSISEPGVRQVVEGALTKVPFALDETVVGSIVARARGSPREALRLLLEEGALADLDDASPPEDWSAPRPRSGA